MDCKRFIHSLPLLQEARKRWDYFITDESVYIHDDIPANVDYDALRYCDLGHDVHSDLRLEVFLNTFRDGNYGGLIEVIRRDAQGIGYTVIGIEYPAGHEIQGTVFMPSDQGIQELQDNRFWPGRAVVWLTRLNEVPSGFWQEFSGPVWVRHNRKHNVPLFRWRDVRVDRDRQFPNKIV